MKFYVVKINVKYKIELLNYSYFELIVTLFYNSLISLNQFIR